MHACWGIPPLEAASPGQKMHAGASLSSRPVAPEEKWRKVNKKLETLNIYACMLGHPSVGNRLLLSCWLTTLFFECVTVSTGKKKSWTEKILTRGTSKEGLQLQKELLQKELLYLSWSWPVLWPSSLQLCLLLQLRGCSRFAPRSAKWET